MPTLPYIPRVCSRHVATLYAMADELFLQTIHLECSMAHAQNQLLCSNSVPSIMLINFKLPGTEANTHSRSAHQVC